MIGAKEPRVRAIVAVGESWAIGKDGGIPWHAPEDMRFFKRTTMGHVVAMGRATWESMGSRPLPGRTNVVLSRSHEAGEDAAGVVWTADLAHPIALARSRGCDLYVAGGARVYEAYRDRIDEWIVTRIPRTVESPDTVLDPSLLEGWEVADREELAPGLVVEYHRRRSPTGP